MEDGCFESSTAARFRIRWPAMLSNSIGLACGTLKLRRASRFKMSSERRYNGFKFKSKNFYRHYCCRVDYLKFRLLTFRVNRKTTFFDKVSDCLKCMRSSKLLPTFAFIKLQRLSTARTVSSETTGSDAFTFSGAAAKAQPSN